MDESQEKQVLECYKDGTLCASIKYSLQNKLRDSIQQYISLTSQWFFGSKRKNEISLFDTSLKNLDFIYVMHTSLRNKFLDKDSRVWTWIENNQVCSKKD